MKRKTLTDKGSISVLIVYLHQQQWGTGGQLQRYSCRQSGSILNPNMELLFNGVQLNFLLILILHLRSKKVMKLKKLFVHLK